MEGRDTRREELLMQMNRIELRISTGHFSLSSPASLNAFFTLPSFLFSLQCINYATQSQHCSYLSKSLLERLNGKCAVPPNCLPHSNSLEKTLIECSLSYLSSSDRALVDEALRISNSVITNSMFKDYFDLNKLLEDLLVVCRAWMTQSLKTVYSALEQLSYLISKHPCTKAAPVLTVLSRFLRQPLKTDEETRCCLVKIIEIFSTLINQGVELRPSDVASLVNVFLFLADYPSTTIANILVPTFINLLEKQPTSISPAIEQQLNDILSRIISSPTGTEIQNLCTELLVQLPLDFSSHQFLLWPCLRLLNRVPAPASNSLFRRVLDVLTQILRSNSELLSSMVRSAALPYLAMILGDNLPADLILLISQLLFIMTKAPEADVLFVGCDFYRRLAYIQTIAVRNGETAVAESIARTLRAIRANCPLVILSLQQTQSGGASKVGKEVSDAMDAIDTSDPSDAIDDSDASDPNDPNEAIDASDASGEDEDKDLAPRADDGEAETSMEEAQTLSKVTDYQISHVSQLTLLKILDFLSRVTKGKMQIGLFTSIFDAWISNKGNSLQPNDIKQIVESLADWVHRSMFNDPSCMHYLTCLDILTRCEWSNSFFMHSVHQKENDRCDESFV